MTGQWRPEGPARPPDESADYDYVKRGVRWYRLSKQAELVPDRLEEAICWRDGRGGDVKERWIWRLVGRHQRLVREQVLGEIMAKRALVDTTPTLE